MGLGLVQNRIRHRFWMGIRPITGSSVAKRFFFASLDLGPTWGGSGGQEPPSSVRPCVRPAGHRFFSDVPGHFYIRFYTIIKFSQPHRRIVVFHIDVLCITTGKFPYSLTVSQSFSLNGVSQIIVPHDL